MDRMPHIGRTRDGIAFAVGYCGTGLLMSTWLGTRAAAWMTAPPPAARGRWRGRRCGQRNGGGA